MSKRKELRPGDELRVGSRVRYQMPGGLFDAVVVEDRGDIGMNGRRLLGIRPLSEYSEGDIVWPAEELFPPDSGSVEYFPDEKRRTTQAKRAAPRGIGVGSHVLYHLPWGTMRAEVIEDRGNIGWKGRRLMRILPIFEGDDGPDAFEVPLEKLTLEE